MGRTRLFARQRESVSSRHRIKAAALVVALAGGLLALVAPPVSAAVDPNPQTSAKNYAGPEGTCPDAATWNCEVIDPGDDNIVVSQTGSENRVFFSNTEDVDASLVDSSTETAQRAEIHQTGASNSIDATFIATHDALKEANLEDVTQIATQRFITRQYGQTNSLTLNGQQTQTATTVFSAVTDVTHDQRTLQYTDSRMCGAGSNETTCTQAGTNGVARISLDRTQTSTAQGAPVGQLQDTTDATEPGEGGRFGLGDVNLIANSASGDTYVVRGNDTKTQTGTGLVGGTVTQQQGHANGGWQFDGDIDSPAGAGSTLDLGTLATGKGLIKTWEQNRISGGEEASTQTQTDPGGFNIPLIGSPDFVTAFIDCNLTADPGAKQICVQRGQGHSHNNITVHAHRDLDDRQGEVVRGKTEPSAKSVKFDSSTCQNLNGCPTSVEEPVTSTHQAVVNTNRGETYGTGHDSPNATGATPGDVVEYKSTLLNESETAAPGATLKTKVPDGTTFVSCGNCSGPDVNRVVTWNLGTVAGEQAASRALRVSVNDAPGGSKITNKATGDHVGSGGPTFSGETTVTVQKQSVDVLISGADKKSGQIPVAVLTDDDFDATEVLVETVCFGDPHEPARPPTGRDCTVGNKGTSNVDADADGDLDKKMHFESAQTGLDKEDTQGCISGFTSEDVYFEGCGPLQKG